MARRAGSGLPIGLGLVGVVVLLFILVLILLCMRSSRASATRFGILVPLACLVAGSAAAVVALESIVLRFFIGYLDDYAEGAGSGYNSVSPLLQVFQLIASGHAFAAAWLTFWHSIKYSKTTRHMAAGHASVAVFMTFIPTGLAIKAFVLGNLDAINMAGAIVTWVLNGLLFLLAVILMASGHWQGQVKQQTQTYHAAPPGMQMHFASTGVYHGPPGVTV